MYPVQNVNDVLVVQ